MPKIIPLGTIDPTLYGIAKRRATMMENGTMSFVGAFENELGRIVFKKVGDVVHAIVEATAIAASNLVGLVHGEKTSYASTVGTGVSAGSQVFEQFEAVGEEIESVHPSMAYNQELFLLTSIDHLTPDGGANWYGYNQSLSLRYGRVDSGQTSVIQLADGFSREEVIPSDVNPVSISTYGNTGSLEAAGMFSGDLACVETRVNGSRTYYGVNNPGEPGAHFFDSSSATTSGKLYVLTSGGLSVVPIKSYSYTSTLSGSVFSPVVSESGETTSGWSITTTGRNEIIAYAVVSLLNRSSSSDPVSSRIDITVSRNGALQTLSSGVSFSDFGVGACIPNATPDDGPSAIFRTFTNDNSGTHIQFFALNSDNESYTLDELNGIPPSAELMFLAGRKLYGYMDGAAFILDIETGQLTANSESWRPRYYAYGNGKTYHVGADKLVLISPSKYLAGVPDIEPPAAGKPYRLKK